MDETLSVVGLGYVGLPVAIAFSRVARVIAFDTNRSKIELYLKGEDPTAEVGAEALGEALKSGRIEFTSEEERLREARFHIVAVPTPLKANHVPDLSCVESASQIVGRNLQAGSVVVYESTVYPGCTEEVCQPLLEAASGLRCGVDFKLGYSPERINPGDREHRLGQVVKIVSGQDEETLERVARAYEQVVSVGVHRAESIRVAEAAKVIENTQRDINIAFVNELSKIFNRLGLDTRQVLKAAGTKWNFLPFKPGLVGGHCIGVDPYYLAQKAQECGYLPEVILAGRRMNESMGEYVASEVVRLMTCKGHCLSGARVLVLGFTFKENCPDVRNTRVVSIVNELSKYGLRVDIYDPVARAAEVQREYGWKMLPELPQAGEACYAGAILAVPHRELLDLDVRSLLLPGGILYDVKGVLPGEVDGHL